MQQKELRYWEILVVWQALHDSYLIIRMQLRLMDKKSIYMFQIVGIIVFNVFELFKYNYSLFLFHFLIVVVV